MRSYAAAGNRRFSRNADKAIFGGVCAGIADYFGFNRRATRFLAIVAFCMAMPITVLIYFAVVFLVPATSGTQKNDGDPEFRQALRASPRQAASDVRRRFKSLDRRLARLEKYVTSSRYQLDREFRNL
ncbi:MAG: PspC domain-containing protein [Proteobacteria bacterium]|nr:PspC domain-containing protein [Pseudomonadota bacterium]